MIFFSTHIKQLFETFVLYAWYRLILSDNIKMISRQVNKHSKNAAKLLKIFHLLFSSMWLGGAIVLTLVAYCIVPCNLHEALIYSRLLDFIDIWMIIVGANGALITGLLYSIWKKWGFFKHKWVFVKWIIVILQVLYGTFVLGPLVTGMVNIAENMNDSLLLYPDFFSNLQKIAIGGTIQLSFLLFLFMISVWKPWKTNLLHQSHE